jgi:hypothetical protein
MRTRAWGAMQDRQHNTVATERDRESERFREHVCFLTSSDQPPTHSPTDNAVLGVMCGM